MIQFNAGGCRDMYFKKYDEHVTYQHPKMCIKNIIFGGIYPDIRGQLHAINHKTGERIYLELEDRVLEGQESQINGKAYDAQGNHCIDIHGSWLSEIKITTFKTGVTETIWREIPSIQDPHL